jgi:hypothetical protein
MSALLADTGTGVVLCDASESGADAITVDALARLQRLAIRRGCRVVLRQASPELLELIVSMGLAEVLPSETVESDLTS